MLNTAATGHHEQSNKSCSLPLEAKTHLSQNPTPPMKFQNPTCQPRLKGWMCHQVGCVSSMNSRAAPMKQQDPSTCSCQ